MHRLTDALSFLNSLQKFGIKLGLEQVSQLLDSVSNPERDLRFIHVAGSNGKGSVSAMLERCLRETGFKTGFFSSPHLVSIFERFRVNGKAINEDDFCSAVEMLKPVAEQMIASKSYPTFFEFTTAMAVVYFKLQNVDWVIWETGMGGRFDATNIVIPELSVITSISLEHQEYLGDTLQLIAGEKAGIIKNNVPVFCNILPAEAEMIIRSKCIQNDSPLHEVPEDYIGRVEHFADKSGIFQNFDYQGHSIRLSLAGKMQRINFKLVFLIIKYLSQQYKFSLTEALHGLAKVSWPGRIQLMPDGSIIDGCHNPDGSAALFESLSGIFPMEKYSIILGSFKDKDTDKILAYLAPLATEFIFVQVTDGMERVGKNGQELITLLRKHSSVPAVAVNNLDEALKIKTLNRRLITGSLYLAGEALSKFIIKEKILNI